MAERRKQGASSRQRSSQTRGGSSSSGARSASRSPARIRVPTVREGPPWQVVFHPDGHKELHVLKEQSDSDYDAVLAVIEKLKIHGPALKSPHQSGVKGALGNGLRELRPTGGRTLVRPLYRRFDNLYVILAIGPEAMIDETGFGNAVKRAQQRRKNIEESN